MAVTIRMSRHGSKKRPFYRVVATDTRSPRDGRYIELLGTYDPTKEPAALDLKMERVNHWIEQGASTSQTVANLIRSARQSA
jgi:small subunit ribosomal protein S16